MSRVPNHPSLLDRIAKVIGGKSATFRFTGTISEAQAILDDFDAKVKATAALPMLPEVRTTDEMVAPLGGAAAPGIAPRLGADVKIAKALEPDRADQ